MNAIDALVKKAREKNAVCLGLDTKEEFFPEYLQKKDIPLCEKMYEFNKKIIDATYDVVACYKVQIAFYEALGLEGLRCYKKTLDAIKEKGALVIADVKRGDIASTAACYAKAHFEGDFEADFMTVNAYIGIDAVEPYFEYMKKGKGIFVLVKTSNPGSGDLQDVKTADGEEVYMKMGRLVKKWGGDFAGSEGFSALGEVAAITYPEEFKKLKAMMPGTFFLIPGYGAQGGKAEDIAEIFKDGICAVVNSSRGIIAYHKGKDEGENFSALTREAALMMGEDIKKWLK